MASDLEFVIFVVENIADDCQITYRKMFGEYTLYSKGKVIGLVADNQLFIKPTEAGKKYLGHYTEAPAYPGAKPSLLIEDKIEETEWLSQLIRITESQLAKPKSKKQSKIKTIKDNN